MSIRKSVKIKAPIDKIFTTLNDFNHWQAWSPWLIQEPEAKVTVNEGAKSYSWEGSRIGHGEMAITSETANESIDYDLTFLKPWKSKAKVKFELRSVGDEVEVTWLMDSSIPFFMFWMKKMIEGFVGMDYVRGLTMLKDLTETGAVPSKIEFKGEEQFNGCNYVGVTTDCSMTAMGETMAKDLSELAAWASENCEITGVPFTVYHKWDAVKGQVSYTSAVPVAKHPESLQNNYVNGTLPEMTTYTIGHHGAYKHLGNAWSTGYNMQQNKAFKMSKKNHPFEVYVSDPTSVSEKELVTEVHFPLK